MHLTRLSQWPPVRRAGFSFRQDDALSAAARETVHAAGASFQTMLTALRAAEARPGVPAVSCTAGKVLSCGLRPCVLMRRGICARASARSDIFYRADAKVHWRNAEA